LAHYDQRAFTNLGNVHLDSVGFNEAMIQFSHWRIFLRFSTRLSERNNDMLKRKGMKLGHCAAIALTGWYLLMPRTSVEYPGGNTDAPLSDWIKAGNATVFRSKDECEHVLDRRRRLTNNRGSKTSLNYLKTAQCVSADDPRLKGK